MPDSASSSRTPEELSSAVDELWKLERRRKSRRKQKQRRRHRRHLREIETHLARATHAAVVMQWSLVTIALVMALALAFTVTVAIQMRQEVAELKTEVEGLRKQARETVSRIDREANQVLQRFQNPFRTLGELIGGRLDSEVGDWLDSEFGAPDGTSSPADSNGTQDNLPAKSEEAGGDDAVPADG